MPMMEGLTHQSEVPICFVNPSSSDECGFYGYTSAIGS
jgi:hypothetical protein